MRKSFKMWYKRVRKYEIRKRIKDMIHRSSKEKEITIMEERQYTNRL